MKKVVLYLSIVAWMVSCNEGLDNWYSETSKYDGRFVVSSACQEFPSKGAIIEDGNEIYLYNTAANIANEIWLEDVSGKFPLKSKITLNGTPENFSGTAKVKNENKKYFIFNEENDEYVEFTPGNSADFPEATAVGQLCDGYQEYAEMTLDEGKIQLNGATSPGGNKVDGIQLKFTLHTDNVKFISALVPEDDWADEDVPEYEWKLQSGSNSPAPNKVEHWTLTGYRYTGYPEDL